jgi:hypothetical protein
VAVSVGLSERPHRKRPLTDESGLVLDGRLLSFPLIDYFQYPNGIDGKAGLWITGFSTRKAANTVAAIMGGGQLSASFSVVR